MPATGQNPRLIRRAEGDGHRESLRAWRVACRGNRTHRARAGQEIGPRAKKWYVLAETPSDWASAQAR